MMERSSMMFKVIIHPMKKKFSGRIPDCSSPYTLTRHQQLVFPRLRERISNSLIAIYPFHDRLSITIGEVSRGCRIATLWIIECVHLRVSLTITRTLMLVTIAGICVSFAFDIKFAFDMVCNTIDNRLNDILQIIGSI